jgi:hypothetical protein
MGCVQIPSSRIGKPAGSNLTVEGVEGVQDGFIAGIESERWRDRRMPAVVAFARLAGQSPGPVNSNLMYSFAQLCFPAPSSLWLVSFGPLAGSNANWIAAGPAKAAG